MESIAKNNIAHRHTQAEWQKGEEGRHTRARDFENSRSEERPEIKNVKPHLCTALNVLCTACTVFIAYVIHTYTIVRKYGRALMFPSD